MLAKELLDLRDEIRRRRQLTLPGAGRRLVLGACAHVFTYSAIFAFCPRPRPGCPRTAAWPRRVPRGRPPPRSRGPAGQGPGRLRFSMRRNGDIGPEGGRHTLLPAESAEHAEMPSGPLMGRMPSTAASSGSWAPPPAHRPGVRDFGQQRPCQDKEAPERRLPSTAPQQVRHFRCGSMATPTMRSRSTEGGGDGGLVDGQTISCLRSPP